MPIDIISVVKFGYITLKEAQKFASKYIISPKIDSDGDLKRHIIETEAWSGSINMFGMARALYTEESSISISISTKPRKFFNQTTDKGSLSENDIIGSRNSSVILGDPGSGKTTIIKRMIRKLITGDPIDIGDDYLFPLRVLGRDLKGGHGLFEDIFYKIGFSLAPKKDNIKDSDIAEWDRSQRERLVEAVLSALQPAKIIIFIDGVDEIDERQRREFERDVEKISNTMSFGKIVMTCRSGDWKGAISNFDVYEMCALSDEEIVEIVELWAEDSHKFMAAINKIPYRDILDRPLFLTMLIIVFNQTGDLPDHPIDVYHRVTSLLIDKWDSERGLHRVSKYAGFLAERKFKFLCAIAYSLISEKKSRFTSADIRQAVGSVSEKFELPAWEYENIIQEIESHTGIIVESGFSNFEFCHLTVQEFLAANYLVGLPNNKYAMALIRSSPATVAVAVSLSSDPTEYMSDIIVSFIRSVLMGRSFNKSTDFSVFKPFLSRLKLESPVILMSENLGFAAIQLAYVYDIICNDLDVHRSKKENISDLDWLFSISSVVESVNLLDKSFVIMDYSPHDSSMIIEFPERRFEMFGEVGKITFSGDMITFFRKRKMLKSLVSGWDSPKGRRNT